MIIGSKGMVKIVISEFVKNKECGREKRKL